MRDDVDQLSADGTLPVGPGKSGQDTAEFSCLPARLGCRQRVILANEAALCFGCVSSHSR